MRKVGDEIKQQIKTMKEQSGTHSPSIDTLLTKIPEIKIKIDACFLSNPYATDLFMNNLNSEIIQKNKLREILEFYPPQNREVAKYISKVTDIDYKNIFVGNGAIEIIQAIIHKFCSKKIIIPIPTFSSYYEFVNPEVEVVFFELNKENNFEFSPSKFVDFVKLHKPDTIVIINPNNPNGGYLKQEQIEYILNSLKEVPNIILDESFIHFAFEDENLNLLGSEKFVSQFPNLIIVKSMSKDFGIAGLRAGYALMNQNRVELLLKNGYLWNVSGLTNYFFKIYQQSSFLKDYEIVRKQYISTTQNFLNGLSAIPGFKVYPSMANFALIELLSEKSSFDFAMELLIDNGIYVRDCSDKIGLSGSFIRVASRSEVENNSIIYALKSNI